jgi:hypothetical protein
LWLDKNNKIKRLIWVKKIDNGEGQMSLIIVDEEFNRGVIRILDMSVELQEIMKLYSDIIQKLMSDGIKDIAIDNVLIGKVNRLNTYSTAMTAIIRSVTDTTSQFLKEIDEADSNLY